MKIAVVTLKHKQNIRWAIRAIKKTALEIDQKNPDIVMSIGGDGTLLEAEHRYPGMPKLIVRESKICHACIKISCDEALKRIEQKRCFIRVLDKLEIVGKKVLALNDIVIRNKTQQEALRFSVQIPGKVKGQLLIGDGLVIATPFGSSGYFFSITRKMFTKGIGIAFNNIHNKRMKPLQVNKKKITVKIIRENAVVTADNQKKTITLRAGQSITVQKAREKAKIIDF